MNPYIFRAYDIRGLYPRDFNKKDALELGKAFGTFIQRKSGPRLVVGHDNRFSSDEIVAGFTGGLLSTGCEVTDIGLTLSPVLHFTVIHYGFDGGAMITASHNPKEYNGFRFDTKKGLPIYNEEIQELRQIIERQEFKKAAGEIRYQEVFEDYYRSIVTRIQLKKRFRVVIDCGNGTASKFAPRVLEGIGAEVVELFCNLDGDYPYHTPNPEERANMRFLQTAVVEHEADVGFAFDTDGDRCGVVDEKGVVYENDKIAILLSRDILQRNPGTRVIYDVKSSYVLEEEIKKAGGEPLMIKTGHPYFKIKMEEDPRILLGAEVAGHTFIKDNYYGFDDGVYAAARLLNYLSHQDQSLNEIFSLIKHTAHTEEIKAPCPDDRKFEIVEKLRASFEGQWRIILIDGLRILFSKTAWALIRPSNTMPALSLRFEAKDLEELNKIIDIVVSRLTQHPIVDIGCLGNLECRTQATHTDGH